MLCEHLQIMHLFGYFLPLHTYKDAPIEGLQYFLEHHRQVLFESTYINQLEFDNIIGLSVCAGIRTTDP